MFKRGLAVMVLLAPLQTLCSPDPKGFLSPRRVKEVKEELTGVLAEVLGDGHGMRSQQMKRIEHVLAPLFGSLPKNHAGHLSSSVMRYAVQRYFGQQNAWILKGFEAHSVTGNISDFSDGAEVLHMKLPEYIRHTLEEKFSRDGFGFKDAVGMIAALEKLTFDEALRGMQTAFQLNLLHTNDELDHEQLVEVLTSYLIVEMLEGDSGDAQQHRFDKKNIRDLYPHWDTTLPFVLDVAENDVFMRQSLSNPFHERSFFFEDAARIAQSITEQFGPWSSHECHEIKDSLVEMDAYRTGRVKLSDFYHSSKDGRWQFREASDYLRQLGALDESSEKLGPQVIIPNYIQGLSNCITSTPFYSVCCQSECNEVYQHLEAVLPPSRDATWSADHIIGAVEGMFEQNISSSLNARLAEVSAHHGGRIPLHGRLLAQWLHFVFPRECSYPHLAETINPQTPGRFEEALGQDASTATDAEVAQFLESEAAKVDPSPEAGSAMWNPHEVTLQAGTPSDMIASNIHSLFSAVAIVGLLVALASLIFKELVPLVMSIKGKKSEFTI